MYGKRMNLLHSFLLLSLLPWRPSQSYEPEAGSGCEDFDETADLCLDGSGSGDEDLESPMYNSPVRSVCRKARLPTWKPNRGGADDDTAYRMVHVCPELYEDEDNTVSKCEKEHHNVNLDGMSLLLPVTSVTTNVTYFNHYCFLCSDDPGPEVTWSVNVSCTQWIQLQSLGSERAVLRAAMNSGHCFVSLQPQGKMAAETCAYKDQPDTALSTKPSPFDPVKVFRPLSKRAPLSLLLHFRDTTTSSDGGGVTEGKETGKDEISSSAGAACFSVQLQDMVEKRCLALNCAPGKRLKRNSCQPVIRRSRGLYYSLTLEMAVFLDRSDVSSKLMSQSLSSLCSLEELVKTGVEEHRRQLQSDVYNLTGWILSANTDMQPRSLLAVSNEDVSDLYFEDSASMSQHGSIHIVEKDQQQPMVLTGRVLVWFDFLVTSYADRHDVEQAAQRMYQEDWHVVCGTTHARLVPRLQGRKVYSDKGSTERGQNLANLNVFAQTVTISGYRKFWTQRRSVPIHVSSLLYCPFLSFPLEEYQIDQLSRDTGDVKTLNLTLWNVTVPFIPVSDVHTDKAGNLKICKSLFEERFYKLFKSKDDLEIDPDAYESSSWALVEYYLSLACVCLSLISLLMTLITYSLFRSLRTIPGQNVMALCCNLFLAQALLQFGVGWTELDIGCVAIGVLIHYFWLTSVLWMNVCSFHMHRVFTAKRAAARMTSSQVKCCTRRVLAYSIFAQGVPLVVIGATVATSILISQGRQVGYGGKACYLSSPFLVGVTFAAPLGFTLVVNLAFFLGAVREIARTEKPVQGIHQNGHRTFSPSPCPTVSHATPFPSTWRRNLNVSIRLSSLTGIFWTLGLIAELFDLSVLRLLSVVVNGSQGVLIAISFLPTRRVARLYSQLCCTCRPHSRQSTSISPPGPAATGSTLTVTLTGTASVSVSGDVNGRLQTSDL